MAKLKVKPIDHPVYSCRMAEGLNGNVGFWVTFYFITDGSLCYTLYSQADWIDQINLMRECGEDIHYFSREVLVSPVSLKSIYFDICRYVSEADIN